MNTPRSRPPVRFTNSAAGRQLNKTPLGVREGGLTNERMLVVLGSILASWPHLEEAMIHFMSDLMGTERHVAPARQVFRSVVSSEARIAIMRSLLEEAEINRDKDSSYDEILDEFASLNRVRNSYAHGLWWTSQDDKKLVWLQETSTDPFASLFGKERRVTLKELVGITQRIGALFDKIYTPKWLHALRAKQGGLTDAGDP